MIRTEFGVSCAGANLYLSKRFKIKGWRGSRNPHRKNSSYKTTRPGWTVNALSSGSGTDNPMISGTKYLTLKASTSSAVMVEATPAGPAGSELTAGGGSERREDTGAVLGGGTTVVGRTLEVDRSRMVTPPVDLKVTGRTRSSSLDEEDDSTAGLLPSLTAWRSMGQKQRKQLTWGVKEDLEDKKTRVAEINQGRRS